MNRSQDARGDLLPLDSALQHERAPRPLPLFLGLLRELSERDPDLARDALVGLRAYGTAKRESRTAAKPEAARAQGASLRDYGGDGPTAVLVPSLINPPRILDLDEQTSLARAITQMGRRALLLDWGKAEERADLSVAGHIEQLMLPLLRSVGERATLVGYCLGGTMAIAAANITPCAGVVTLAAPWHFDRYPEHAKAALQAMWRHSEATARQLGALPMEVLQAAFWSLDPERTVRKFAEFGRLERGSDEARRFVELEEWANEGEPLPYPAAKELFEEMFDRDLPGSGKWLVAGRAMTDSVPVPILNLTATHDLIAPAVTAPAGVALGLDSGHVGMIVGSARRALHAAIRSFLIQHA